MINKNSNKLNKKSLKPNNQNIINYKNPATKSFPQTIASENNEDFYEMTFKFQKIMMIYESAIKMIETKLEVLSKEYKITF